MLYRIIGILILAILLVQACSRSTSDFDHLSFEDEIQPIIWKNCSGCHNSNGAAPFSLITYEDVVRKSKTIKEVLEDGSMPPWPADENYRHYLGEKILDNEDRLRLLAWLDSDKLRIEGINKDTNYIASNEVLKYYCLPEPIEIKGNNLDHFRLAKIPIELEQDTFISYVEFIPDNRKLIHHMNGHWLNYDPIKKTDLISGKTSVDTDSDTDLRLFLELGIPHDDGSFPELIPSVVNYLPGMEALRYPKGIGGFRTSKKSTLLMQSIHYGPSPKDTIDQSCIVLHYTNGPPERPLKEMQLGSLGVSPVEPALIIKPNEKRSFITKWTISKDISLLTVIPHMHLLGTKFKAYALSPTNDTIRLVKINKWDFRWQYFYTFEKIQKIPAGYTIIAEGNFDNTSENPNQAFDPPKTIIEPKSLNMKTTDEMFQLIIMYIDYKEGDEHISLMP